RLRGEDQDRVHWLTYGNHTATNLFKHVKHVFLLGLNFQPRALSHAASGAALDLNLLDAHPTEAQIDEMQRGLLMDSSLQAILRGTARHGVNGDCGGMTVILPQVKQTGLTTNELQTMFPNVRVGQDQVLIPGKPLKGKLQELDAIVAKRLDAGETEMTHPSLYRELGMAKSNFASLVKKPEWQAHIAARRLQEVLPKGSPAVLRKG
ncbi:MAG: hypothetical protein JOY91_09345, partial [Sinobacteraceae bacterium]|nr:hypothetical protein [Nevskiaceae bacterium]